MIFILLFGGFIGVIFFIVAMSTRKHTICPKCKNKVYYTKNVAECEYCKTRFILDENTKEIKEILNQ